MKRWLPSWRTRQHIYLTLEALAFLVAAAVLTVCIATGQPWWQTAWVACGTGGWGFSAAFRAGLAGRWTRRRTAKHLLQMVEISDRILAYQAEARPEVMDQVEWTRASLAAKLPEVEAVANGSKRLSEAQWNLLWHRLMVDLAPSLEQAAIDRPTRYNRSFARMARREARRAKS